MEIGIALTPVNYSVVTLSTLWMEAVDKF